MIETETSKPLAELNRTSLAIAGGKGANLGDLVQAGFPIPPGFVVTTAAYRSFVEANRLQEQILALAAQPAADDAAAYEEVADQIHALFLNGALPAAVADAIRAAYTALAEESDRDKRWAVAVRSSATAEDLPTASFAGQQETFLNVRAVEVLLEATKQCWASLWTARAIAYRVRQGIEHDAVAMGVVVQTMVEADVAGILFTANPNTGARDELLVEASYGLGEAIVGGQVTPDTFILDRESLSVQETRLGSKEVMVVVDAGGRDGNRTKTQPVPTGLREEASLSGLLLSELGALGVRVEEHFGSTPQDIEWAVISGRIWLLQARPITNLPVAPLRNVRWEPLRPGTIWMRRQVVEHMPEPLSPLFDELYLEEGLSQSMDEIAAVLVEVTGVKFNIRDFYAPPFATTVNGYAYSIASFEMSWRVVPKILRIYTAALPKMLRQMLPYWRDQALPQYRATIDHWKALDLTSASDAELLHGIRSLAIADAIYWFAAAVPLGLARITDALLDGFLKRVAGERNSAHGPRPTSGPYLRGFPSKTLDAQAQLEAIARQIAGTDALRTRVMEAPASHLLTMLEQDPAGAPVVEDIYHYLDTYGHQIYNLDFVAPTQANDPLPVLLSLKSAVEHPERDAREHQAELAREREALFAQTIQTLNPLQRRIFRLLLDWAQHYTPYREEALFYVGAAWPTLRQLALELGRRLTAAGSLHAPDDVFYLKSTELETASASRLQGVGRLGLARLAQERRALREARKRLDPPVSVPPNAQLKIGPVRLRMFEPQPEGDDAEGPTLHGFAVSPGHVTAAASIIRSPADFDQMQPDTILVCPTTTPAWTPLFSQAKGLVTDIGGALAHGSIVAREYGIPAVMGTGNATKRISSGQHIQVDGDSGTVTLVDKVDTAGLSHTSPQPDAEQQSAFNPLHRVPLVLAVGAIVAVVVWWRRRWQHS